MKKKERQIHKQDEKDEKRALEKILKECKLPINEENKNISFNDEWEKEKYIVHMRRLHNEKEQKEHDTWKNSLEQAENDKIKLQQQRQKILDEKERIRQEDIDHKNYLNRLEILERKEKFNKKYEYTVKTFEDDLIQRRHVRILIYIYKKYKNKVDLNEVRYSSLAKLRGLAFQECTEKTIKKNQKIHDIQKKNKEEEHQKLLNYFEKKSIIEQKKKELEEAKLEDIRRKKYSKRTKEEHVDKKIKLCKEYYNRYTESLIEKQQMDDLRVS